MQLENLHILIVEDSIMARNKLLEYLEELNVGEVSEAGGGEMALALVDKLQEEGKSLDLMLLDWNMPQMDGVDVLKALKDKANFKDLKILMVSAERDKNQIVNALSLGAHGFLSKPVTIESLKDKIVEVMSGETLNSTGS